MNPDALCIDCRGCFCVEYAIVEKGREIGRLRTRQDGLYTVFEARLPPRAGLTRLYLCGNGESRLLGVMEPRADGCFLCRRLSRRGQPGVIEYASTEAEAEPPEKSGWTPGANGMLCDRGARLLAIPAEPGKALEKMRSMRINGKEYIVFRW